VLAVRSSTFVCSEILLEIRQPICLRFRLQYGYTCASSHVKQQVYVRYSIHMESTLDSQNSAVATQSTALTSRATATNSQPVSRRTLSKVPQELLTNKIYATSLKIPNIQQSVTEIFVWQLAILDSSRCTTNCLFVLVSLLVCQLYLSVLQVCSLCIFTEKPHCW